MRPVARALFFWAGEINTGYILDTVGNIVLPYNVAYGEKRTKNNNETIKQLLPAHASAFASKPLTKLKRK